MKRPISIKIESSIHDAALDLLKTNKIKHRSFTAMVEQALMDLIEREKIKSYEDKE